MKRGLFKFVLFLFLGAVISCLEVVIVEAGIHWKDYMNSGRITWLGRSSQQIPYWSYESRDHFSRTSVSAFRVSSDPGRRPNIPIDTNGLPYWFNERGETDRFPVATYQIALGWPLRMLYYGVYWYDEQIPYSKIPVVFWLDREKPQAAIHFLWKGFAVNTAFYAALVWLMFMCLITLRRMIRRKRAKCIQCRYDLRGNPKNGCPECGWGREDGG